MGVAEVVALAVVVERSFGFAVDLVAAPFLALFALFIVSVELVVRWVVVCLRGFFCLGVG